jgi:hypothetical protein
MCPVVKGPSRTILSLLLAALMVMPVQAAAPRGSSPPQGAHGRWVAPSDKAKSPQATINVTVNALSNRHTISPYVYGVNFPNDTTYVQQTGATLVRWGGNASTRYNWKNFDTNAANDWYFADGAFGSPPLYQDSTQFLSNIVGAGGFPIMTIGMLPWAAKDATSYSFSVAKYGAQCGVNPYNSDDGDGVKTDCFTNVTGNDPNDANVPLLDQPGGGDPPGSVYRDQWVPALAPNYGTAPHFYNMDNEMDIWGSTHRDVHPNPTGYDEMENVFLTEAGGLKTWDTKAVRFGPVSCCWWFYWNGANNSDKNLHGGIDFLPWWMNEIAWTDKVSGKRSLDVFDVHAYPDTPDLSSWTQSQKQALALRIFRDYWDPTYVSESPSINQPWVTQMQPNKTIPFRLPRLRAIANAVYPNTPISITEWNAALAGESDFSTALADADAWGIMGRERVYAASRWVAADPSTPAYLTLQLLRNYDNAHHGFGNVSVSATNDGDPSLFSSYAALNSGGTTLTLLAINKDPSATDSAQITLTGFNPSQVTTYTLGQANPTKIVASTKQAWTSSWSFAPYSATLLVVSGTLAQKPASDWDINPETTMAPASGRTTLHPRLVSGSSTVTLASVTSDSGVTMTIKQPVVSKSQQGSISVMSGATPGFYHFTVTGNDSSGVTQTESGWILVGNPAATFTKSGDGQIGPPGGQLTLSVTLNPGQSAGTAQGATVLFTTNGGTLSSRMVRTDATGKAVVVLTLPNSPGKVQVSAQGPFGLGYPAATFTETAQ